jgi:hypothetical protein
VSGWKEYSASPTTFAAIRCRAARALPRSSIQPSAPQSYRFQKYYLAQKFGSQPREPVAKAAFRPKDALERIASASFKGDRHEQIHASLRKGCGGADGFRRFGNIRYSGVVVGFAVLGAMFARISSSVLELPNISASDGIGLIRHIAAGDLSGTLAGAAPQAKLQALAMRKFGDGYRAILIAASTLLRASTRCLPPNIFGAELSQPKSQGQQECLQSNLTNSNFPSSQLKLSQ